MASTEDRHGVQPGSGRESLPQAPQIDRQFNMHGSDMDGATPTAADVSPGAKIGGLPLPPR